MAWGCIECNNGTRICGDPTPGSDACIGAPGLGWKADQAEGWELLGCSCVGVWTRTVKGKVEIAYGPIHPSECCSGNKGGD